jgi:chloramphenicol O-acetyltransferase type B
MGLRRLLEKLRIVRPPTKRTRKLSDIYPDYRIGKWSYGNPAIFNRNEGTTFEIGSFCSIASGVKIFLGGEHRTDWVTTYPFNILWEQAKHITGHPRSKGNVIIGNDVWIGRDAVILSGVTIGDGAVIGARSLVAKDIPPYGIVGGNPARLLRKRFDEPTIERLLALKWWDWQDEKIERMLPLLLSSDLDAFFAAAEESAGPR